MAYTFPNAGDWAPGNYQIPRYQPQGAPFAQNAYPYFDWNNSYGGDRDWVNTPAIGGPGGYLEQNPNVLYNMWTSPWASGDDPFSRYVQSQYNDVYGGYQTAFAKNPLITFKDYLSGMSPYFFSGRYRQLTPQQRGWSNGLFGAGKMQWLL